MLKGRKKQVIAAAALAVAGVIAAGVWNNKQAATMSAYFIDPTDQTLVANGKNIYDAQCAACHGANLQGQFNWRKRLPNGRLPAPPHDASGHTWHHPDAQLFDMVKNGLVPGRTAPDDYESDMPAFASTLSDRDIIAVLAYIKSRWPKDALAAQKRVTLESGR